MKKIKFAALAVIMTVLLSGCEIRDNLIPDDLENQYFSIARMGDIGYGTAVKKVDMNHSAFAEKCFDSIEVFGATFALPMNVCDLPEDFTININRYTAKSNIYNGFDFYSTKILCDGSRVMDAKIMCPVGGDPMEGQIVTVSLKYGLSAWGAESKIVLGEALDDFSMENIFAYLGECEKNNYIIYEQGGGKTICFAFTHPDTGSDLVYVELSVIGAQEL